MKDKVIIFLGFGTWVLDPARDKWLLGVEMSETKNNPFGNKNAKMQPMRTPIATAVTTLDLRGECELVLFIKGPSLRPIMVGFWVSHLKSLLSGRFCPVLWGLRG